MGKKLFSLCMALALCLGLLPVTALAVAPIGQVLYVGGVQISSTGYWTTDSEGNVTASTAGETPTDNYISYDAENNVLTLHNATIKKGLEYSENIEGGTYIFGSAIGVLNQNGAAELTITLEGTNTIAEVGKGIFVLASSTSTGGATLTITGGGSLNASASQTGIWVQSNGNNAALCVENAEVTASPDGAVKNGVLVQAKDGSDVSLTVNGGSLTASVNANIWFQFGSSASGSGTPTVTVSNNAIVRANGGIANNSSSPIQYETGSDSTGGIVFDGNTGTVYGSVTLQEDLTIGEDESLTIPDGASLTIDSGATLTNEGTVTNSGTLTNNGTIDNSGTLTGTISGNAPPSITTTSLADGAENTAYTATLAADGEPASWTWNADANSSLPPGLTLSGNSISGTPTTTGTYNFTVTATNSGGSDSKPLSITISSATNIPVQSVSLDKTSLELTEGGTGTLIATVEPNNAINKNVTWSTSNASIATVNNGEVTAVSAGTATITVTTADGGKTDTCTVIVREEAPDRPVNLPDTHSIDLIVSDGGEAKLNLTNASEGATITVTATPDEGYELAYITVDGERISGTTFTMPDSDVTVRVYFREAGSAFTDVPANAYYAGAVSWAVANGITDGTGAGTFSPDAPCTRAEVVTFLWRAMGSPEPLGDNSFTDVPADSYYSKAVQWALEEGITSGTGADTFSPDAVCTRAEVVTFLMRALDGQGAGSAGFSDVPAGSYYSEAVAWAVANGITEGTSATTFSPDAQCTRAQIVTFLYRAVA